MSFEDTLRGIVRDEVRSALAELRQPAPAALADRAGLAVELGMSVRTIARLERAGMPFVGAGRLRRFDVAACRAWLERRGQREGVVDVDARAEALLARGRR